MLDLDKIAMIVIKYRVENKLTQQELANKIGVSNKTICDIENGKNTVRKRTLINVISKIQGGI